MEVEFASSFGFTVRSRENMTTSEQVIGSVLSGHSEGFRSAQQSPVVSSKPDRGPSDLDSRPVSAVSADSASFYTPESYDLSSLENEEIDLVVEIPEVDSPPTNHYIVDQPKLALAEEERVNGHEKPYLSNEYTPHNEPLMITNGHPGNSRGALVDNRDHMANEQTPLLPSNSAPQKTNCCVLL